jgi:hypothetical protein
MGRPLKTAKVNPDNATPGDIVDGGYDQPYGVVGGNTGTTGTQIQARVKIGANAEANGWIIRQKGARKFLATDGTNIGQCSLVNQPNGSLGANEMTITVTDAGAVTHRLAKLGDTFGIDFTGQGYILSFGAASATPPAGSIYPVVTVASA